MTGDRTQACPERPVHVGGGQHAVDRAVVVDEEVLAARVAVDRPDQLLAGDADGER